LTYYEATTDGSENANIDDLVIDHPLEAPNKVLFEDP